MDTDRSDPLFSWFIPVDGDGHHIGTTLPERPPQFAMLRSVAGAAESAGFHSVLVPTRFANGLFDATAPLAETWTMATALAAVTTRLRFLVAVRPGFISPGLFAQMAATLADLSDGRLDLNIVPGGIQGEYERFGVTTSHDDRYGHAKELIDALRALWSADRPIDFDGDVVHLRGVQATMAGTTRRPLFYTGGASDAALDLAASHADVLLAWIQPLDALEALVRRVRARRSDLRLGLRTHLVFADREQDAWDGARELLSQASSAVRAQRQSTFAGTAMVGQQAQLRTSDDPVDAHRIDAHLWNGISTVRVNCGTAIVGDYDQVAAELERYWQLGFDEFILSSWPHAEGATAVAREVIPRVRAAINPSR